MVKLEPYYNIESEIYRKYVKPGIVGDNEIYIVTKLKELENKTSYNKNLIKIFNIGYDDKGKFYETELLDTYYRIRKENNIDKEKILYKQIYKLNETRRFLQMNGISYIDWKMDNFGLSLIDKEIKLFDFDCSGIFQNTIKDIPAKWIIEPINSYNYKFGNIIFGKYSFNNNPQNIDTFLFRVLLFNLDNKQIDLPV